MAACPSCSTENPPGARFCQECGAPLKLGCEACGEPLPPSAKFCPSCGAPAGAAPASAPAGAREERRFVTILFVDLVGFTERSDRADPEDVRRTLVPFHARVKEDIERFGCGACHIIPGIRGAEAATLIRRFFADRRSG